VVEMCALHVESRFFRLVFPRQSIVKAVGTGLNFCFIPNDSITVSCDLWKPWKIPQINKLYMKGKINVSWYFAGISWGQILAILNGRIINKW